MSQTIKQPPTKAGRSRLDRSGGCVVAADISAFRDWTVFDLKLRVKELGIEGFSDKTRAELIQMIQQG